MEICTRCGLGHEAGRPHGSVRRLNDTDSILQAVVAQLLSSSHTRHTSIRPAVLPAGDGMTLDRADGSAVHCFLDQAG